MSWTEESLLSAFPRDNMQYFIQFIEEPKVIEKKGKYGSWTELSISLQFFARDEDLQFHYMGSKALAVKPCALEELSLFGPDIVTRLIHVKGCQHGKHVDLTLEDSWDRISASANQRDAHTEQEGPPKPQAGDIETIPAISEPPAACSHSNCHLVSYEGSATPEQTGFYCKDCGERVG